MIYRASFVCTGAGRQVISGAKSFKWKRVWASQLSAESSWAGHTSAGLVGLDGLCPTRAAGKPRHVGGTKMIWFWTIHFPHENWSLSHCHIRRRPDCRSIWNWWYIWISIHIYIYIHVYGSIYPSIWIYLVSSGLWRLSASPSTAEVFAEPRCDHGPLSKKTGPDDQMGNYCNCCFGCSLANIFLKLYAIWYFQFVLYVIAHWVVLLLVQSTVTCPPG